MLSHLYYCGLLVFYADENIKCHNAIIKHSLSCARCRGGSRPLRDLYRMETRNDLKELMIGRLMNGVRLDNYFSQDLIYLEDLLDSGTRREVIIPAAKRLVHMVLKEPGFHFFCIEAWLYTSIFKTPNDMYNILPFPGPASLQSPKLPRRVLKLSGSVVHLVEPGPDQVGCYFALSHRWGTSKKLLLTRKTLNKLKKGILARSLPKTFRDAVTVTNQFGCSFLWIDSLCIFQDDIDDWLRESTLMANIYHQATCVIAAHTAQDDSEGFLSFIGPFPIQDHTSQSYPEFNEHVNKSGLSKRGWVFQERILSKRILHFANHRLFLEDASGIALVNGGSLIRLSGHAPGDSKLNIEDAFHNSVQWCRLVERYSHCELTCDIDRLPAISGLARVFATMNDCSRFSCSGRFMFGLWHESLHVSLLWIQTASNPVRLRDAYRSGWPCPTWSWAAWKGSLGFPPCLEAFESCISVQQEKEPPPDSMVIENLGPQNPMLAISGKLRTLSDVQVTFEGSTESNIKCSERRCGFVSKSPTMHGTAFFDGLRPGDERRFERIWLLLVAKHCDKRPVIVEEDAGTIVYRFNFTYYYLILEGAGEPGLYRRIGTGARSGPNFWGNAPETTVFII